MALRWYSIVVDCRDVRAQAAWWAEALGWKEIYEADDEVVLVPQHASEELLRSMPWAQVPPGLVFVPVPEGKTVKNRLHIDLAPTRPTTGRRRSSACSVWEPSVSTWARHPTSPGTSSPTPRGTSSASCRRETCSAPIARGGGRLGRAQQRWFERLARRVLDGPGRLDARYRRAAAQRDLPALPEELRAYVGKVHDHAYRIVDGEIEALLAAGYSEDEVFELTAAAAVGAGLDRLDRGRRAMDGH
jgi:hypothetical protein